MNSQPSTVSLAGVHKIDYLDGLRGLAAFAVVVSHLITGFYPALYTGDTRQAHNAWEVWAAGSPFNAVSIGNCFVCIFFMLSAYVLTHSVLSKNRANYLPSLCIGRYVRLTIPILVANILAYFILAQGWDSHVRAAEVSNSYWWLPTLYKLEPNFIAMVKESVYGVYQYNTSYNAALWTMRIELLGSFMVFGILACCRSFRLRIGAYCVVSLFFFSPYYFCFVVGMFLYDVRRWIAEAHIVNGAVSRVVTAGLLLTGLFLGSYPYAYTAETWYQGIADLLVPTLSGRAIVISHLVGAIFLLLAVERSGRMKKILQGRIFQFWGRNAFAIYILHLILIASVFSGVFNRVQTWLPYNAAILVASVVFFLVLLMVSNAVYFCVDHPSVRLSRGIARLIGTAQDKLLQKIWMKSGKVRAPGNLKFPKY